MKFTVSSSLLLKHLQGPAGVISPSNALPILDCFYFQVKDGILKISASDLETTMTTSLPVASQDEINIAIPSRILLDTLKAFPDQSLTFTINEKKGIEMSSVLGTYKLTGFDGMDFPKTAEVKEASVFEIEEGSLLKAISKTLFAVGDDELRPAMCGVYMLIDSTGMTFVSTDTHKFVKYKRNETKSEQVNSYIIPKKPLALLKSILTVGKVKISYNKTNVCFSFGDTQIISRLIDAKYPNYEAVIPKNQPNNLTVSRNDFLNSIKRVSIFSNRNSNQICLKIRQNEMTILAEDLDYANEAKESIKCVYKGADLDIGFNSRFLTELLSTMEGDEIMFELNTATGPGIMKPITDGTAKEDDIMMLIMPVMTTQN